MALGHGGEYKVTSLTLPISPTPVTDISAYATHTTLSMSATGTTSAFRILGKGVLSIVINAPTGDDVGTFSVLIDNDSDGDFNEEAIPTASKASGSACEERLVLNDPGGAWAKVKYTRSSGTDDETATLSILSSIV